MGDSSVRTKGFYQTMFLIAALYDVFLGFVFFLFFKSIFAALNIRLPENTSYLQLSAAFVFVQGLGYYFVYRNLQRNVDMVWVGLVYKVVYISVDFYYWALGGLPHPVFSLFAFLDLIFAVLFVFYLRDYNSLFMKTS